MGKTLRYILKNLKTVSGKVHVAMPIKEEVMNLERRGGLDKEEGRQGRSDIDACLKFLKIMYVCVCTNAQSTLLLKLLKEKKDNH